MDPAHHVPPVQQVRVRVHVRQARVLRRLNVCYVCGCTTRLICKELPHRGVSSAAAYRRIPACARPCASASVPRSLPMGPFPVHPASRVQPLCAYRTPCRTVDPLQVRRPQAVPRRLREAVCGDVRGELETREQCAIRRPIGLNRQRVTPYLPEMYVAGWKPHTLSIWVWPQGSLSEQGGLRNSA